MAQDECGCTENNCPHKTSEVTLWDGVFTNITVPSGAGLNEVLALLENYATSTSVCNDVNYTLTAYSACLNLPAGTYSFSQIIGAIVGVICANASSIAELQAQVALVVTTSTTNVTLDGIILPSCFSAFSGTTSTALFNIILQNLCVLMSQTAPVIGDPIVVTPPDPGTTVDPFPPTSEFALNNAPVELIAEALKSFVDNNSFIYDQTSPIVNPTSFVVRVNPMRGVVDNYIVVRKVLEELTVNATMDTYFYLGSNGYVFRREVAVGAPAPPTPSGTHPLYLITSDGSGVVLVTDLFTANALNPIPLGVDDVLTVNILDGAVTTPKIAPVTTGTTVGHLALVLVTNNDQGQVTSLTSNLSMASITNGQILVYNSGLNRMENADNTYIPAIGRVPKSNASADNYEASSILETASQVLSEKKVEINTGVVENDANAKLNVVGGPILIPRLTAVSASALPVTDGYFIYVTTTNGTFTSVGFWGAQAAAWVKL